MTDQKEDHSPKIAKGRVTATGDRRSVTIKSVDCGSAQEVLSADLDGQAGSFEVRAAKLGLSRRLGWALVDREQSLPPMLSCEMLKVEMDKLGVWCGNARVRQQLLLER